MKKFKLKIGNTVRKDNITPGSIYNLILDGSNLNLTRDGEIVDSVSLGTIIPEMEVTIFRYSISSTKPNISDDPNSPDYYNNRDAWKETFPNNSTVWIASRVFIGGLPKPNTQWIIVNYKGDASGYSMVINPSLLPVDIDLDKLYELIAKVYNNGVEITEGYTLNWSFGGSSVTGVITTSDNSKCIVSGNTKQIPNGSFISCNLEVNGVVVAMYSIPFLRNSQKLISEFLFNNRGKWLTNNIYYNDTISGEKRFGNAMKYVDIVMYNGKYYMPCVAQTINVTTPPNTNTEEWKESFSLDFAYILNLIVDTIKATSIQANELLLTKDETDPSLNIDNTFVVAGMTSGDRILANDKNENVRIFAGASALTEVDSNGHILDQLDVTSAPFKVYENGKVVANDIIINGSAYLNQLKTNLVQLLTNDISLKDFLNYNYYILYCYKDITIDDSGILAIVNGKIYSNTNNKLNVNLLYLLVNVSTNFIIIQLLSSASFGAKYTKLLPIEPTSINISRVASDNMSVTISIDENDIRYKIELIEAGTVESFTPISINYYPVNYYYQGLKDIESSEGENRLLLEIKIYKENIDSKLYLKVNNSDPFQSINVSNYDDVTLHLYLNKDLGFKYDSNESSVYWLGDMSDGKYLFINTELRGGENNREEYIAKSWTDGGELLYKNFLLKNIRLLVSATINANVEPSVIMENGCVLNPNTNIVEGYIDLSNNVTSYTNEEFYIQDEADIRIVPPNTTRIPLSNLDIYTILSDEPESPSPQDPNS